MAVRIAAEVAKSDLSERGRHPRRDVAQEREVPRVEPRVLRLAERIGRRYPRERPRLQLVANADRVDAFLGRTREQRERVVGRGRDACRWAGAIGIGLYEAGSCKS